MNHLNSTLPTIGACGYLRHGHFFIIVATCGEHEFFTAEVMVFGFLAGQEDHCREFVTFLKECEGN